MSIHIHLYDCNCIFCTSDFPIDFFQTHNSGGPDTQSMTAKQPEDEADPLDDYSDLDDDDEDEEDDSDDDEDDEECDEPKPQEKKKLFGFLIGSHNICVL
ncbi:MAG: hypothetical protein PHQ75_15295 [Thermoguttaceae bacterium]|nr:hypothetical protein [Thermoguttaceae bacterium]